MCLYWPEYHLAVNIVDDPHSPDFEQNQDPKAKVLSITTKQIYDQESMAELANAISEHIGINKGSDSCDPVWSARNKRLLEELICGIF